MKTKFPLLICIVATMHFAAQAQVKIGNNPTSINSASLLEMETTNQGLVLPRVSLTSVSSSSPLPAGLLTATVVYNTNSSTTGGSGAGIYYWDGSKWNFIANTNTTASNWTLTGNSGTSASTNFIGTTDAIDFVARTNNLERLRITSAGNVGIGISNPAYALSVLSAGNPLYLSGVQATGAFTTDSVLTIYNGVVKKAPYSAITGATTNTLSLSTNTLTSTVNGVAATASAVGSVSNTSSANTIKTTVNGVAGSTVNIINSNTNALTQAGGLVNTVNGVAATTSIPSGTVSSLLGYNASGSPVYQPLSGISLSTAWNTTGNAGTSAATNFLGTTDANPLIFKVNNTQAGYLGTTSNYSTAFGLSASASGNQSTAIGAKAQATASNASLAVGYSATASAQDAIAIGDAAQATTNNEAIAIGHSAQASAYQGIAIGTSSTASTNNQTIAIGASTTASGYQGVAIGNSASATTNNSALAIGVSASASGYQSTAIGSSATATAQNATAIGNGASATNANTLILGNGANVGIGITNPSNKLSVLASSDPLYLSGVQATSSFTSDSVLTINAGVVRKSPYSSLTGNFWNLNGNAASSGNFLGTTNTTPLVFKFNSLSAGYIDATSTSLGTGSSATAASSNTAIGYSAVASNSDHETAIGANATATAQYNTALGYNAQAVNNVQATAIGSTAQANAYQSTALGYNAQATTNSQTTALGNSSLANGTYSTAIGYFAQAVTNAQTTAVGGLSTSNGYQSAAFGYNAQAITNSQTTAIGVGSVASSTASTALGYNAQAKTNSNGTALGSNSTTTGQNSTAIGSFATASAQNATAVGYNTTAGNANTLILGNGANVGIGTTNPSNALSVLATTDPLYLSGVQATSTFNTDSVLTINGGVVRKTPYSSLTGNFWSLTGNAGTNYTSNFLGTTDNAGLHVRTNNTERMVIDSIGSVSIGSNNFDPYLREKFLVDYGTTSSNNVATFTGSINDYLQINVQNKNSGVNASSDVVATADNGTDSTNYVDFGINSSTYAPGTENFGGPNDAYLYSYSRNLLLGTGKSNSDIIFLSGGGVLKTNTVLRIDGSTGNIIVGKGNNSSLATGNTVRAPNAGGTNIGGGILTLQGGSATGTGAGGNVVLNGGTSPSGTAGNIVVNTASTERLRVDQNGNVGIGTSSPSNKLSVISSSNPLYLSGVQTTSTPTSDSILTINAGVVKKSAYSSVFTIAKYLYSVTLPAVANNGGAYLDITVANTPYTAGGPNPVIAINPEIDLPTGLVIAWSRVVATNTVRVQFRNVSNQGITSQTISFDLSVFQ